MTKASGVGERRRGRRIMTYLQCQQGNVGGVSASNPLVSWRDFTLCVFHGEAQLGKSAKPR